MVFVPNQNFLRVGDRVSLTTTKDINMDNQPYGYYLKGHEFTLIENHILRGMIFRDTENRDMVVKLEPNEYRKIS